MTDSIISSSGAARRSLLPLPFLLALALAGAAPAAAGCALVDGFSGGPDAGDDVSDGDIEEEDAAPETPDSATEEFCAAPPVMPPGFLENGSAARNEDAVAVFRASLIGPPRDVYQLELWRNLAPFSGEILPGTYIIDESQSDYETCGVCVLIYGDVDDDGNARQHYIAESGTVVIDFIDEFSISGSISEVTLVSYDDGPRGQCTTTVGSTAFAATIGSF